MDSSTCCDARQISYRAGVGAEDSVRSAAHGCCCVDELRRPDPNLVLRQAMVVQVPLLPPKLRRLGALPVPLESTIVHILRHHEPAHVKKDSARLAAH